MSSIFTRLSGLCKAAFAEACKILFLLLDTMAERMFSSAAPTTYSWLPWQEEEEQENNLQDSAGQQD